MLLEIGLFLGQLRRLRRFRRLYRRHACLHVLCSLKVGALELDTSADELVLGVGRPFYFNRQAGDQRGEAHRLLPHFEPTFDFFHLRGTGKQNHDVSGVCRFYRHGGSAATVDHSLNLGLSNSRATKQQK